MKRRTVNVQCCSFGLPYQFCHIDLGLKPNKSRLKIHLSSHGHQVDSQSWFDATSVTDLMNVTEEVTIHRTNVLTLLSCAFIRGDLNTATRGPFV